MTRALSELPRQNDLKELSIVIPNTRYEQLSSALCQVSSLISVELRPYGIRHKSIANLPQDLNLPVFLRELKIESTLLGEASVTQLLSKIDSLPNLESLEFKVGFSLSQDLLDQIIECIIRSSTLCKLYVHFSGFDNPNGICKFLRDISERSSVTELYIDDHDRSVILGIDLVQALKFSHILTRLNIANIEINGSWYKEIQAFMESNDTLTYASIDDESVYSSKDISNAPLLDEQLGSLITFCRTIAISKRTAATQLPLETILHIASHLCSASPRQKERLRLIARCLTDRNTLGKIQCKIVGCNLSVLYVRSRSALVAIRSN